MNDQQAERPERRETASPGGDQSRGDTAAAPAILDGISDGLVSLDNEWRLIYANAAAARMWGRDLGPMLGRSIDELLDIRADNPFRLMYLASKRNGMPISFASYSEMFADWIDVRGYPHESGYTILFRPASQDRQIKETAESERGATRSINQRIFDTSLDLILVVDRRGNFVRVSPSSQAILGHTPDEMNGRSAQDFVYPGDLESTRTNMRLARRGRLTRNFECRYVHKNGRLVPLAWTGVWSDPDGQYFFIGRDMSERIALEAQLLQARKMEAVGQLTGGVAHDFNNILTVIIGMTELLSDALKDDKDLGPIVALVDEAASRGAQLTQRMLAFARKQPLQASRVDLNGIAERTVTILQRTLGAEIAVASKLAGDLWPAFADASQIEDAILNLAVNARDAMPKGGRLLIETENAVLDEHYAAQNVDVTPGEYVSVSVTDSGVGISPDVLERVFEPFFTTKDIGEGTGLGLSMVYGFVKQSHGHVKIYSEVGHGTSIRIYLPRVTDTEAKTPAVTEARPAGAIRGHETILVVEDTEPVRTVAVNVLRGLGYQVLEAADGPSALAILREPHKIDLLFTDLIMPNGIDGEELLRRARELRPGLKALFTSGYSEQFLRSRSSGSDLDDVPLLSKPYRAQKLAAALRDVLDGEKS